MSVRNVAERLAEYRRQKAAARAQVCVILLKVFH